MKSKIMRILLVMSIAFSSAFSQITNQQNLKVYAENFKNNKGQAIANLFVKGESLKKKPAHQLISKIVDGKAIFEFSDLPFADYAVIVFHDKNANSDLDHSWGMPSEPLGYSNNWRFSLFAGMPTFEKLRFNYSQQSNSITLKVN
jgi:uncharacterized protein (DUF2141 family)